MAKHAHRILLAKKKTWRCTLPGCNWFIHIGLAERILMGKLIVCWECGEDFITDERALADDQPICQQCRDKRDGGIPFDELDKYIESKLALSRTHEIKLKDQIEVDEED